jgi:predicted phosphate transport protein (TIGR00153 family)
MKTMARNRDYNYFDKFVELVDYSCKCAEILHDTLVNFDVNTLEEKVKGLHSIEHSGDLAKHDMMAQLAREFIAPIEREDIVILSQEIDDITDSIEDVLMKIHMFNISSIKPEALEFTKLITRCSNSLKVALKEFHNYKRSSTLKEKLIEVSHLEEEGDRLYYNTIRSMYVNSKDPLELYVWTEIYDLLEKCCDACAHTADTVESVVMKNS